MKVHPLFSSSAGNATLIYNKESQILIDVGVSYTQLLSKINIKFKPDAIFITHEHIDHVKGAGIVGRKTLAPVYIAEQSYNKKPDDFNGCDINFIAGGDVIETAGFKVEPFSTRHDSKASLGYIITDKINNKKFGYVTDTGSFSKLMSVTLVGCDGYLVEADYDKDLLLNYDEYDQYLKERIMGPWGHLSNEQTINFIKEVIDLDKVAWVLIGHISTKTNSPEKILSLIKENFPKHFKKFECVPLENYKEL